jgi:hypothetical protein
MEDDVDVFAVGPFIPFIFFQRTSSPPFPCFLFFHPAAAKVQIKLRLHCSSFDGLQMATADSIKGPRLIREHLVNIFLHLYSVIAGIGRAPFNTRTACKYFSICTPALPALKGPRLIREHLVNNLAFIPRRCRHRKGLV